MNDSAKIRNNQHSKPLDQLNRDWTKGNCFYTALEFLKDSEMLLQEGALPEEAKLVHGTLNSSKTPIQHAWIECGGKVMDNANNEGLCVPKELYYHQRDARCSRTFSRQEADAILMKHGQGGEFPIGFWGGLSDQEVNDCLSEYEKDKGPFAKGVVFSDPTDASNRQNLVLKTHSKKTASAES